METVHEVDSLLYVLPVDCKILIVTHRIRVQKGKEKYDLYVCTTTLNIRQILFHAAKKNVDLVFDDFRTNVTVIKHAAQLQKIFVNTVLFLLFIVKTDAIKTNFRPYSIF